MGKPYHKYNYENKRTKLETQQDKTTSCAYCHDTVIKLAVEQKNKGRPVCNTVELELIAFYSPSLNKCCPTKTEAPT